MSNREKPKAKAVSASDTLASLTRRIKRAEDRKVMQQKRIAALEKSVEIQNHNAATIVKVMENNARRITDLEKQMSTGVHTLRNQQEQMRRLRDSIDELLSRSSGGGQYLGTIYK